MIQLSYTIFYVINVEKTIAFYEKAFGFSKKFITPDHTYGELLTGDTTLAFASSAFVKTNLKKGFIENSNENKPFAQEIGLTTDDVQVAVTAAVNAGATIYEPATTKPWGQVVAYVRDLDGFLIEICTPMN